MSPAITKLLSISGGPCSRLIDAEGPMRYLSRWGVIGEELCELLRAKNGFYAYESSLLVRPLDQSSSPLGVRDWNTLQLWREHYVPELPDALFFAEDIFGGQFCIWADKICTFDPETAKLEVVSSSLEGWAEDVIENYEFRTGYPLAHSWQIENAPIEHGVRLLPKTPFVCGGRYQVGNLYPINDVRGMRFRASISNQIHDVPDGSQIVLKLSGNETRGR